jgi:hypothetical protein
VNRRSGSKYNTQQRIFLKSSQKPISNIYGADGTGIKVVDGHDSRKNRKDDPHVEGMYNVLKRKKSKFEAPCPCGYNLRTGAPEYYYYWVSWPVFYERSLIIWIQKLILRSAAINYTKAQFNYDLRFCFDEYKSQVEHLKYGLEDPKENPNITEFQKGTKKARKELNLCQEFVTLSFFLPVLFGAIEVQGLITMLLYIAGYFELASFSLYVQLLSICTIQFFKTCIFLPRPFVPIHNYYFAYMPVLPVSFVTILIYIQQSMLIL